jgi:vancomycin resistance protein VanW
MKRRLFCEIAPCTYWLSVQKERLKRTVRDGLSGLAFARSKGDLLPVVLCAHQSLIRRKLGNIDARLQENKAVNLALAAPAVDRVLIRPGEVFSFWRLVGRCTKGKGYREGLTIANGKTARGVGGGMCQFTNLLHWMTLHSPLDVLERRHHNRFDLFPDSGRTVPFGLGTSIMYNYLDYRVQNNTNHTFQFVVHTTPTHLCGELRADSPVPYDYRIDERDSHFVRRDGRYYRRNKVFRTVTDKATDAVVESALISESDAEVCYDGAYIPKELLRGK